MNKQELLKDYRKQEDRMCLSQVLDKIEFCKAREKLEYTDFLDMYQVSLVENFLKKVYFKNYQLFGGYGESERKILIIYPEKYNEKMIEKNYHKMLKVVRIDLPEEEQGKYSHRNYLGGIVKLGLKREKVGDILVSDEGADIVVVQDFAEILKKELPSLTRFENSKISIEEISNIRKKEIKIEEVSIIVPSLRLDNIVSDLAKTSRSKAAQIISQERVFVNGKNETKLSKQLKLDDVITIRGKGRFVIKEFTGTTRSGRTVIKVEKYV
jgi:RNA-binding protein YlmH